MAFRIKLYFSQIREHLNRDLEGNPLALEALDHLMEDLLKKRLEGQALSEEELYRILHAMEFAAEKHKKQTRRNIEKTPYITHPLHVARHILITGHIYDADILMAALLHDTVEDTETTLDELRNLFGYRVEQLVAELTDEKDLTKEERKNQQIQKAQSRSSDAALIILADKLSNLMDLMERPPVGWELARIDDYFLWAQQVVRLLPEANPYLRNAVEEVIDAYWQRQIE